MLVLNFDDTDMTMDDRTKATPGKTSRTEKSQSTISTGKAAAAASALSLKKPFLLPGP